MPTIYFYAKLYFYIIDYSRKKFNIKLPYAGLHIKKPDHF